MKLGICHERPIRTWHAIETSIVFPLEAVSMSPGLMPPPLIMFSHAATMKLTCHAHYQHPDTETVNLKVHRYGQITSPIQKHHLLKSTIVMHK